jgi:hypothetical protein
VNKGDAPAAGSAARHLVDEAVARRPAPLERPVEIGHAIAEVVNPWAASGEELRHGALRVARFEQLDLNVAQREADDRCAVGRFPVSRREAEDVPVEGQDLGDAGYGDADMRDARGLVRHVAEHNDWIRGSAGS